MKSGHPATWRAEMRSNADFRLDCHLAWRWGRVKAKSCSDPSRYNVTKLAEDRTQPSPRLPLGVAVGRVETLATDHPFGISHGLRINRNSVTPNFPTEKNPSKGFNFPRSVLDGIRIRNEGRGFETALVLTLVGQPSPAMIRVSPQGKSWTEPGFETRERIRKPSWS